MAYGEPIHVSQSDDLDKKAAELKAALDDVTQKSDVVSGCRD